MRVEQLNRLLAPIKRRIQQMFTRGVVHLVDADTLMQRLQVKTLSEHPDWVEHFEPYGYTSHPKKGAEALVGRVGNHTVAFCVADRRFRLKELESGEVALYDDQGQTIILHRGYTQITTPKLIIDAAESQLTGHLLVGGNITAPNGTISASGTVLS